ncbi:MAG: NYN domain-containing protein [Lachnospiraceae bacterium]|nr:NYN domain-containing protein [Lachnospiraceae bacterium]
MEEKKFALLIDADNISSKYIKIIIEELSKYGTITYKRLYGDLTKSNNKSWKNALLSHSINPVQQYNYTTGKNSTDSAMIIDAMDILYSGSVNGFCLATSDSDFTRLAMRLRESGMTVIGMGEQKTPEPFRVSCERFFYIDLLSDEEDTDEEKNPDGNTETDAVTPMAALESLISKIIMENGINGNSMDIGELGSRITKYDTAFDIRNYGYTKFSKFLENFKNIELKFTENTVTAILKDSEISLMAVENDIINILSECDKNSCYTGQLSQKLLALHPSFNYENYGYTRFSKLLSDLKSVKVTSLGRVVTLNADYAPKKNVIQKNTVLKKAPQKNKAK